MLVVALGILIEIPLLGYVLTRNDGNATVLAPSESTSGGTLRGLTLHPVAGTFKPDDTTLTECADQRCYEQAYGNVAFRQGPKRAFALVVKQFPGGADPNCHRIAHAIGAAALARNDGNVSRTFAEGSSTCWSGYYHGVLERAFAAWSRYDARTLGAKARGSVPGPRVRKSSWLNYQCLHGLGHGLMITTGYQLPLVLEVCGQLGGRLGAHVLQGRRLHGEHPHVVRRRVAVGPRDDPLYPCNWVAEGDKYPCYQNATTRILRVVGLDWKKVAADVREGGAPSSSTTCFGSFGQNASVNSASASRRTIVATCAIARPYDGEEECIRYAAMDITGTYSNGRRRRSLCDASVAAVQASCYEAIGLMLRMSETPWPSAAQSAARSRQPPACRACIRGSTQVSSIPGLAR